VRKIMIVLVCLLMLAAVPSLLAQEGISVKGASISSKLTTDHSIPGFGC
jgi:LEA14-like dessication related protein